MTNLNNAYFVGNTIFNKGTNAENFAEAAKHGLPQQFPLDTDAEATLGWDWEEIDCETGRVAKVFTFKVGDVDMSDLYIGCQGINEFEESNGLSSLKVVMKKESKIRGLKFKYIPLDRVSASEYIDTARNAIINSSR